MAPIEMPDRYADPGALLAAAHQLDGGDPVRLRLTRPSDAQRVREFLERLSPESRRLRFLVPMPTIRQGIVRHFTFYDPRERLVLAATLPVAGSERIAGLADIVLLETGLAEIGVVVADDQCGRGLGKLLAEAVATIALRNGATHLKAEMVDRNERMLAIMRRLGSTVTTSEQGNSVAYTKLNPQALRQAA
jgi:RimJ/RimL family protein N-acetyltransferase